MKNIFEIVEFLVAMVFILFFTSLGFVVTTILLVSKTVMWVIHKPNGGKKKLTLDPSETFHQTFELFVENF